MHSYPYHSQGNEAECFMEPLGKAIKVAFDTNKPVQEAIGDLLTDYRSTPYPATGLTPGDMVFRGGSTIPNFLERLHRLIAKLKKLKDAIRSEKPRSMPNKMPLAGKSTHILSREKMSLLCVLKLEGNFSHCMNQPLTL